MAWHGGILDGGKPMDIDIDPRYGKYKVLSTQSFLFVYFVPCSSSISFPGLFAPTMEVPCEMILKRDWPLIARIAHKTNPAPVFFAL